MKIAKREIVYSKHCGHNPPQFMVKPDEVFKAETELCTGGWLLNETDIWSPDKTTGCNPTVVVSVEGAQPGGLLAVDIIEIIPGRLGYTGFDNNSNPLAHRIFPRDWGGTLKTVTIENGFVNWSGKLKLPISPMLGVLGTAPYGESLFNSRAGEHGGNMDVQEVAAGATVYLPIEVPGALLHIGDAHAIQGDGEINCSGGIECRAEVTLKTRLLPRPAEYGSVRIETESFIATVGSRRGFEESFHYATAQLIKWMAADYGFTQREAYLLLGQVMQARSTQFVNPTNSYICKVYKKFL